MRELLASDDAITGVTKAIALYFTGAIGFWQHPEDVKPTLTESAALFHEADAPDGEALALISLALALLTGDAPDPAEATRCLETALELFRGSDDRWGESLVLVSMGRVALLTGDTAGALERFQSSLELTRAQHDEVAEEIALHHIGWARFLTQSIDEAGTAFRQSLDVAVQLGHVEGIAYGLEGLVAVAAAANDVELAGTLLGAAECLRRQSGTYNSPTFSFHLQAVAPILASAAATQFETAREEGSRLALGPLLSLVSQSEVTDARP
jgi:tetratricopeptide (TPR) repeat protein